VLVGSWIKTIRITKEDRMSFLRTAAWFAGCLSVLVVCSGVASATDIGGTISTTLTITDDSQLVDDVTCTVTGAPCIVIGASVTLELNGFTMTGQADPQTACNGAGTGSEIGIDINGQTGFSIRGPGLVKQFRGFGIRLLNSTGGTVVGVTTSTNCFSGIFVTGGSGHRLDRNVAVRNGNVSSPCGGI
jgi:hypothetical protein